MSRCFCCVKLVVWTQSVERDPLSVASSSESGVSLPLEGLPGAEGGQGRWSSIGIKDRANGTSQCFHGEACVLRNQ